MVLTVVIQIVAENFVGLKMFYIDPEKLINAVKARPSLYNKNYKMCYKNRNHIREMLWFEVTEEVLENTLPLKDKRSLVLEVQKRWRSLRSCFARELAIQKTEEARRADGNGCIKRRKTYEFFDSMLFLKGKAGEIKNKKDSSSTELPGNCKNEGVCLYGYSEEIVGDIKSEASDESDYEIKDTKVFENKDKIKIDAAMKIEDHDEDKQFALSIVPSLRKLDFKSNLEAKIQILKAIQAVTRQGIINID